MNKDVISFEPIKKGGPGWEEICRFAASFGHKIDNRSLSPVVAVRRGSKLFAYFFFLKFPILLPSFHPELTTPRDFVDMVEQVRAGAWLTSMGLDQFPQGICYAAFDQEPVISKDIIQKIGFKSTKCELWESYPGVNGEESP
jgi:hypothetical protein